MAYTAETHSVPFGQHVGGHVWETELDRVDVIQCSSAGEEDEFLIRLIGPGYSVNLHFQAPRNGGLSANMEATLDAIPEDGQDIVEYRVSRRDRFLADIPALLRRYGWDRWTLTRHSGDSRRYGCRAWLYYVVARLLSRDEIGLQMTVVRAEPVSHLWKVLFPKGSDLRESTSCCPELGEAAAIQRGQEWEAHESWRTEFVLSRELDDMQFETAETLEASEEKSVVD